MNLQRILQAKQVALDAKLFVNQIQQAVQEYRVVFQLFDIDHDGFIDGPEV